MKVPLCPYLPHSFPLLQLEAEEQRPSLALAHYHIPAPSTVPIIQQVPNTYLNEWMDFAERIS